jgi:hypothetical protein
MWYVEFIDYNITATKRGEKFWKEISELPSPELIMELHEACDCEPDNTLHTNGGHYHGIVRLYKLDDENMLYVYNTTRESFTPWEQGFILVRKYWKKGKRMFSIWTETIGDCHSWVVEKEKLDILINDLVRRGYYIVEKHF